MQATNFPASFVGITERFYVLRNEGLLLPRKYAQYTSVNAYDTRAEVPVYVDAAQAMTDFVAEVSVYAETLTTTPPAYRADHDETDFGLTPARNFWASRFASAKASPHAA